VTTKQSILKAIDELPANASYGDAIRAIHTLKRIEIGELAADEGKVRPHEEVRALIHNGLSDV
jgi:hypothetical protein